MKFSERSGDDPGAADAAIACLRGGGLLAHPTTGVYGLGGIPGDGRAAEVARLKGRPEGPGIVYLVADREVVRRGFPAAGWSPAAERLAAAFWPGPLTLVLPDGSTYGVAVRAEAHPVTRAVLAALREPLGSSSLNRTGDPPAADEGMARRALSGMPATASDVLFLAAGTLPGPPPSTLVRLGWGDDASPAEWEVLREGAVPRDAIALALSSSREAG